MAYTCHERLGVPRIGEVDEVELIPLRGVAEIGPDTPTDVLAAAERVHAQRTRSSRCGCGPRRPARRRSASA